MTEKKHKKNQVEDTHEFARDIEELFDKEGHVRTNLRVLEHPTNEAPVNTYLFRNNYYPQTFNGRPTFYRTAKSHILVVEA